MRFTSETTSDGVWERFFTLDDIPGVLWSPAGATGQRPLVLLAHGGGQHKTVASLVSRAHRFVTNCGFAVVAIDAPGHGDRPRSERDQQLVGAIRKRVEAGEPLGPQLARYHAVLAEQVIPEWRAVLDSVAIDGIAGGPIGFGGMSMGCALGVPFVAAEPRISAAVFGLAGGPALAEAAARITVPIEFLLQWDDERVSRDLSLALFDAFASGEKTLHANPGGHADVPAFELESSERFFVRHLGGVRGCHPSG